MRLLDLGTLRILVSERNPVKNLAISPNNDTAPYHDIVAMHNIESTGNLRPTRNITSEENPDYVFNQVAKDSPKQGNILVEPISESHECQHVYGVVEKQTFKFHAPRAAIRLR
jgi:hypothetical protein